MVKIAVNGAMGRMGKRVLDLASQSADFKVTASFDVKPPKLSAAGLKGTDVLIDFSNPKATRPCVQAALGAACALVIGTTGQDPEALRAIREASKKIAVVFSPNMSIGANFLFELVRLAGRKLGAGYDIEIIEAHHRLKKDAPSGTAKRIAEAIAQEKGWNLGKVVRGIHVIRAGEIVGEHTVLFSGPGETLELKHTALSRDAFARGALAAALFVSKKEKGLYSMADVLR